MKLVEQLNSSRILPIMLVLVAFALGSAFMTAGSAGPLGLWPFP